MSGARALRRGASAILDTLSDGTPRRGVGEPPADFDFEIPGPRGGTRRTRHLGQLEGVKPETKELAHKAREKLAASQTARNTPSSDSASPDSAPAQPVVPDAEVIAQPHPTTPSDVSKDSP